MDTKRISFFATGLLLLCSVAAAQGERSAIRQGNELYKKSKYAESGKKYTEALAIDSLNVVALFNFAGSAYKLGKWKEASQIYAQVSNSLGAAAYYNGGNTQFKQQQFDAAIEEYKKALRLDPTDREAKFNLAYAQKMKQEQEQKQEQKQEGGKDDQKDDQKQDQQQNQQDQNQDQKQDKKEQQEEQQQPKPDRSDAERMLKAIQAAEEKIKDKVEAQKATAPQKRGGKDW